MRLFDAARAWLAARDIHQIRGPVNPSLNYECGLLVDGFHMPPTFMMTYNPPYYARLIENYGFRKAQDLFAFWAQDRASFPKLDAKLLFVAQEAASRLGLEMRPLDKSRFRQEIEMFLDLYNQSLGGTWGFVPLSKREIDHMSASLKHLIIPELAMVASVEGKPIGAVFAIPDYNPRIKEIDGRLFPFGFLKLLSKRQAFPPVSGDQRQRDSRISALGRRAGAAPQPDSQNPRIEIRRRRILVGARIEPPLPPQPGKRGGRARKDLSHLRLSAAGRKPAEAGAATQPVHAGCIAEAVVSLRSPGLQSPQRRQSRHRLPRQAWHSRLNRRAPAVQMRRSLGSCDRVAAGRGVCRGRRFASESKAGPSDVHSPGLTVCAIGRIGWQFGHQPLVGPAQVVIGERGKQMVQGVKPQADRHRHLAQQPRIRIVHRVEQLIDKGHFARPALI